MLFFSLFGGVVADRVDKRRFLVFSQSIFMVLAFILSALVHLHLIRVWQVALLAFLNGLTMAFDAPARQAYVQDLVGKKDLMNGIALNSTAFNGARILGPAIAGLLVVHVGMAICFFLNGVSFLPFIGALLLIRTPPPPDRENHQNVWENLKEGLTYIRRDPVIRLLILMVAVRSIFGMPYATLMPLMAGDILKVGAVGLGKLMSATGIGALIGALGVARFGHQRRKGITLFKADICFALALIGFALSRSFPLSLALLAFLGASWVTYTATANTLLQTLAAEELRGRVISAYMLVFGGMTPLANLQAGAMARWLGVPSALFLGGAICGTFALWVALSRPNIRSLE